MTAENKSALTIPHDFEAEQAVLGAIIFNNQTMTDIAGTLTPNSFYSENHRHIYRAMLELVDANEPIDEIILGDQLKEFGKLEDIGGYAYLAELVDCVPSSGNIVYYAKIIQEHALLRDLITTTSDISRKSRDPQQSISELLAEAENKITEIAIRSKDSDCYHIRDSLVKSYEKCEEATKTKNEITGLPCGFADLDRMIYGLQPSDLIILAARPSMGKTALALNIASYAAINHKSEGAILVFSLEMSADQLTMRMISSESRIDSRKLRTGDIEQEDWDRLAKATARLSDAPIYINDTQGITPYEVATICKRMDQQFENGVSLVIVDYLQLMRSNRACVSREQEIAEISRALKGLAKDLNVPVVALSQLNRALENRKDKRPILSDLRDSGSIEQDADIILFIYRDEVYNDNSDNKGIAEIIIAKHRNGPTGMIELVFTGKHTKFGNISKIDPPTYKTYE